MRSPASARPRRQLALVVLLGAVVVALLALPVRHRWWGGWLLAIAEAGIVGGLADWFAVTAIFRRPLGLPIPVPVKKSIRLSRLNFPHHRHHCSGRVSAQTPCLMPGGPDDCRDWSLDLPSRLVPRAGGRRPREPCAPPPTAGPSALRHPTPALPLGWDPLGLAVPLVEWLAPQSRHRSARYRPRLAPPRLPALLALAVHSDPGRPAAARRRDPPPHPTHGAGESHLGPPAHPGGTRPARPRGRRADRRQVHAPDVASAVAHVARLLTAHARELVAIDFFLVPTLTFRLLFVFVVLRHDCRTLLHLNVTDHPTATWTARQLVEAFPDDSAAQFLLRDRDTIYGDEFARRVERMGIRQVLIAPRAPWQNPFVERIIGSIRRVCLNHFLILNEAHLRRLLPAYLGYYNAARPVLRQKRVRLTWRLSLL